MALVDHSKGPQKTASLVPGAEATRGPDDTRH
jgi:hypothetical protein